MLLARRLEALAARREGGLCRGESMPVSQLFGWQGRFAYLSQIQPVGAPEARSQALARWRQLPAYLERELAALREGVQRGYVVPAGNVRVVLTQLDAILALGPDNSPFADPARRDSTTAFRAAWHELMERSEEHTSELQSQSNLVCRLLLEKKKNAHCQAPPAPRVSLRYPPIPLRPCTYTARHLSVRGASSNIPPLDHHITLATRTGTTSYR